MNAGIIGGCIALVILTIAVIIGLKKLGDDKAVDKFIDGLEDKILKVVLETIADANPNNFEDFNQFNQILIKNTYDAVWDFVSYTAQEELLEDKITKNVFKLIDKEKVIEFLNALYDKEDISQIIQDAYGRVAIQELINDDEDEKLQKEYSDQTLYVEDLTNFELPPAEEKEIPPEELAKIIPPVEEEDESLDLEDDSVELIVDKPEIIITEDKNGNTLYYEVDQNGKKTKISKAVALQKLGEQK